MFRKVMLLSLLLFQTGCITGMQSPILPMDVMPSIIKHVIRSPIDEIILQQKNNLSKPYLSVQQNYALQLVSKDFRRMFWDYFTLKEKDRIVFCICEYQNISCIVDIAVSMRASLAPVLQYYIYHYSKPNALQIVTDIVKIADTDTVNALKYRTLLRWAIECDCFDIAQLLLSCPLVDVNKTTPLYSAVHPKRIDCLKLLLAHPDIQINAVNQEGETALFAIADYFWNGHKDALREVIDLLIKAGIDSTIKNKRGETVFDVVRNEVFEVLEQAFAQDRNI